MNEMQLLEEFRAVVAPPDPGTLAQARARVLAGAPAGQASRRARWPRLPGRWPKLALTGLAAAATATAVAVALAAPGGTPSHPGAASLVAKELAYRVAGVAAARPDVRSGQWVYRLEKSVAPHAVVPGGTAPWWSTADGTRTALQYNNKVHILRCPYSQSLPHGGCKPEMFLTTDGLGADIPLTYAELGSLPRSPAALDRYLASLPLPGGEPAPVREFEIIGGMLITYVMPPALTAELYRALGDIPGVTADQHAVDVAGRAGIGFQITAPHSPAGDAPVREVAQLLLNPKTYDLMAVQTLSTNQRPSSLPRHTLSGTAILKTALVSGPGILP
jgi:hypothetical protein